MGQSTGLPAGWYADSQVEGGERYWNGTAWTSRRLALSATAQAPAAPPSSSPAPQGSRTRAANARAPRASRTAGHPVSDVPKSDIARNNAAKRRIPLVTLLVGVPIAIALLLSLLGGAGVFLVMLGLIALLTGLYVVITKRRSWARLPASRMVGVGLIVAALAVTGVGGGVSAATRPTPAALLATSDSTAPGGIAGSPVPGMVSPTPTSTVDVADETAQADVQTVSVPPDGASVVAADTSATTGTALAVLATLAVKGRAPKTGYDRVGQFGTAWLDVDRNGCDTRNDILARDLLDAAKSGPCRVLSGILNDPYSGKTISFIRGNTTSTLGQIDHVVALSDAWQKGAQQLTAAQPISLANDPLNLWAVDGAINQAKSDGDAATWLPPQKSFRCEYAARQISVKATYGLWVTTAEHDALAGILQACPDQPAVSSTFTPTAAVAAPAQSSAGGSADAPARAAPVEPAAPAEPEPAAPAPSDVFYANCAAVRAAGAAPIHRGEPGYTSKLDRDNDGVACET